jgi:5-methylcytosine-specific restriction endonuclease McrA
MKARRDEWVIVNGPCARCGSNDNLEVDHLDPGSKLIQPAKLWSMAPDNPKRIAELAKCQVLCETCHLAKTKAELRELHRGEKSSTATLTDEQAKEVKQRLSLGERSIDIARELKVSKNAISRIKRGVSFK